MSGLSVIIIALICLAGGAVGGYYLTSFLKMNKSQKIETTKKWLLYAVVKAEEALGSSTGELKLAKVYNEFVTELPQAAQVISYEEFSALVKVVLKELENIIQNNEAIADLVTGAEG